MTSPLPESVTDVSHIHGQTGLSPDAETAAAASSSAAPSATTPSIDAKLKTRALGRGREGDSKARPSDIMVGGLNPSSPPRLPGPEGQRSGSPFQSAVSPGRSNLMRSSSPRHLSPATSQIFERDVVDPNVPSELSPAIPAHIQTEDHIPPVLEAASSALTDDHLGQDDIEIVTHTAHEPASVTVTGSSTNLHAMSESTSHLSHMSSLNELAAPSAEHDAESASAYGVVDPLDPRRLSFISFADVVHSEHQEAGHAAHPLSISSTAASLAGDRSPEPIRSPLSSGGSPPPAGGAGASSFRAGEASPVRGAAAPSVSSGQGGGHGELTIETMRHAIQKTSNHNEGTLSAPMSAVSEDGGMPGRFPPSIPLSGAGQQIAEAC
ncbi:hypothetical protein FH972_024940 [Carpinus fangiana]|uniref:Uncharacterized protein n=1 Tax=Carpinus fangiana TaxID=176857 RepID=A0A5N6KZK3_9ROSI|nr:hypothetical protein FH972_024940 [Carpinus fangiana]